MAKHLVKCSICGETFDASVEPFEKTFNGRRYAHKHCYEEKESSKSQEEKDKEALIEYIKQLFGIDRLNAHINKQLKDYIEINHYTYSGIHRALIYHFEIKKGDISKANGGIGIVGYVYQQAHDYYYSIWLAQQKNEQKIENINIYIPQEKVIKIPIPQTKVKKRRLFSFLDKEEE
jgi:hypothetical protein